MKIFCLLILMLSVSSWAEIGKITKTMGTDGYLLRANQKMALSTDLSLELGDEVFTNSTPAVIFLYPSTQISLSTSSQIKLTESVIEENNGTERVSSIIELIKGVIRTLVTKSKDQDIEQKIQTNGASFAVRGTEFEVSLLGDDVELDVIEGVVEASSPLINSFVPEYVKANEGLRLSRKERKFSRRKFALKFKQHPGFERSDKIRQKWLEVKKRRLKQRTSRIKSRRKNRR